jgi:hypothetical protein
MNEEVLIRNKWIRREEGKRVDEGVGVQMKGRS